MKKHLIDFFDFIKNPKDEKSKETDSSYKWKVLFSLLFFEFVFIMFYLPLLSLVNESFEFDEAYDLDLTLYVQFLLFILLIPFVEELIFRFPLRRRGLFKVFFDLNIWNKYYKWFFYCSVLTFGFIHITNYEINSIWIIILAPFIVLSQIIGGAIMAYLRIRFNFWMGFFYHALWNFIFVFLASSFVVFTAKETMIIESDYELQVKEKSVFNSDSKTLLFSGADSIYQLETKAHRTQEILSYIDTNSFNYKPIIEYIDIKFSSEKGIPIDSLITILEEEGYIEKRKSTY